MTISSLRHLTATLVAVCALAVAGCGGSKKEPTGTKLPASAVSSLNQRLAEVQRRYDDATTNDNPGACDDIARDSFPAVKKIIDGLPESVDAKLRDATTESFANLQRLTDQGCRNVSAPTPTNTTPTPTDTTPTETTPPPTTPTQTTPTGTTPQKPKPEKKPKKTPPGTGGTGGQIPGGGSPQGGGTEAPSGNGN